jgi:hypothetical protein
MDLDKNILVDMVQYLQNRLDHKRELSTKASRTYRQGHRDKINAISKRYYDTHKEDAEWLEAKREKQRIYQRKRRFMKALAKEAEVNTQ